jgi:DNA/RNA endonuclease YhcR with UshA esterase domain
MSRNLAVLLLLLTSVGWSENCVPFDQAGDHIGKKVCISGKVLKVTQSESGSYFIDFCEDYRKCPFTVVVFRSNLKNIGDVTALAGKDIEISGKIEEWRGRAEIILKDAAQLRGESAKLPPAPGAYDASRQGNFSAGKFKGNHSTHPTHKRQPKSMDPEIDQE